MANEPKSKTDLTFEAIDLEAANDPERSDSKILYQALSARRHELGGTNQIPADDKQLTEKILGQARRRSEAISGTRRGFSDRLPKAGKSIPWWLIVAWLIAVIAVVGYFRL